MKSSLTFLLLLMVAIISAFSGKKSLDDYFGVNLIKNPGAEEKTVEQKIPNWTFNSETSRRETIHGTYREDKGWKKGCKDNCGLLPNSGKSYFRLPIDTINSRISLSQEIDLSPIADIINERRISTDIDGFVAGTFCENKKCITASIVNAAYDKDGNLLSGIYSTNADNSFFEYIETRGDKIYKFKKLGSSSALPKGTSKIIIKLEGQKADCCDNATVYFDNLSYVLSKGELR